MGIGETDTKRGEGPYQSTSAHRTVRAERKELRFRKFNLSGVHLKPSFSMFEVSFRLSFSAMWNTTDPLKWRQ